MRIPALPLKGKLGRQLGILDIYFGRFSSPLAIEYQSDCAPKAK